MWRRGLWGRGLIPPFSSLAPEQLWDRLPSLGSEQDGGRQRHSLLPLRRQWQLPSGTFNSVTHVLFSTPVRRARHVTSQNPFQIDHWWDPGPH